MEDHQQLWKDRFCTEAEVSATDLARKSEAGTRGEKLRQVTLGSLAAWHILPFPPHLPGLSCLLPAHTSLEVQEEPSVAEVEVSVITVLVHQLEELRVQDLPGKATGSSAELSRGTSTSSACLPSHCSPTMPPSTWLQHPATPKLQALYSPQLAFLCSTTESSSQPL